MKIPVRYNHVGYAPQCAKIFFVNTKDLPCDGLAVDDYFFRIVKVGRGVDGVQVYEGRFRDGTFEHGGLCEYTGELLWSGFGGQGARRLYNPDLAEKPHREGNAVV